jgi:predicted transglutaminase-like cysteine proteinase
LKRWPVIAAALLLVIIASTAVSACHKAPPEFEITALDITPSEVTIGNTITINAQIKNVGARTGACAITLTINYAETQTKTIKIAPQKTKTVSFVVSKDTPGRYDVEVNGLRGSFRVLKPVEFILSNLIIEPPIANTGQVVIITAEITNAGEIAGNYLASLKVNGNQIEAKELTIAPSSSERVSFTFTEEAMGYYNIEVRKLSALIIVSETGKILSQLKNAYPELYEELFKLPDLKEIDERDEEALEDIAYLALNTKYRAAFEAMLNEGIKDKRKYCTPLEALLWIAYDREFDGYNPLRNYSLSVLRYDAWENTTTSRNYASDRWHDFDEVVDRLNSLELVSLYMQNNFQWISDLTLYGREDYLAGPKETFDKKKGDCEDHARFGVYCLTKNGYKMSSLSLQYETDAVSELYVRKRTSDGKLDWGHAVTLYKKDNSFYFIDTGQGQKMGLINGPFNTIEEVARSISPYWTEYSLFNDPKSLVYKKDK